MLIPIASIPGTVAGTYYSAVQTDVGVTVFSSVVIPSGMDYYVNATFANGHFPYQCGERLRRCNVTIVRESPGPKVAAVTSLDQGVGLALFNVSTNHTTLVDQYVISLLDFEPTLSCNFTSFVDTVDPIHTDDTGATLYGFCYNFLSMSNSDEVEMWIFKVVVNFNQLNDSHLVLLYRDKSPYGLSSTELSNPFYFGNDVCASPSARVMWHDDGFLYIWRTDTGTFFSFYTEQPLCHADDVSQVELFRGNQLLAYCSNNTVVEIDVCRAGGFTVPSLAYNPTRFYCSRVDNSTYVEQKDHNSILISRNRLEVSFSHSLNTSFCCVDDCLNVTGKIFFISSSTDGTIVFTDILSNSTTILTEGATVPHQVIQNRYILYSNFTSSVLLDMTCPSPTTPVRVFKVPFNLANFAPDNDFSCSTVQPTELAIAPTMEESLNVTTDDISNVTTDNVTVTTASMDIEQTTSVTIATGDLSGWEIVVILVFCAILVVVVIIIIIIIVVVVIKCIPNNQKRYVYLCIEVSCLCATD